MPFFRKKPVVTLTTNLSSITDSGMSSSPTWRNSPMPEPSPSDAGKIATTLSFLASAIKSGETWSPMCDRMLREAYDALYRITPKKD